ncbi:MAG: methyl-accepting chemotaxis protein, partial [Pseudomonadota bacterium]
MASTDDALLSELVGSLNALLDTFDSVIGDAVSVIEDMSRGDLDGAMQPQSAGMFRDLALAVNRTLTRLRDIIAEVGASSAGIDAEVREISGNAANLSERSSHQAAALEENSATMEEITSTVKSNAANAEDALVLANEASSRAHRGGEIVGDAAAAMERINESSGRISDIVSVIDSIAFQTNLLALNAAVEAARAGESGKGFAVVASEVRTLAQRSSESARDIRELIDNSSSYVADGVRLVAATGDALTEIVSSITSVSATVEEITEASKEQAKGVEEISTSIASLDTITQENAMIASTNAGSAAKLKTRAEDLRGQLSFFGGAAIDAASARDDIAAAPAPARQSEEAADAAWEAAAG